MFKLVLVPYIFVDKITYIFVLFKCNYSVLYILITHDLTSLLIVFVGIMCYKTWNFKNWSNTKNKLDVNIWKCTLKNYGDLYILFLFGDNVVSIVQANTQTLTYNITIHAIYSSRQYIFTYLSKIKRAINLKNQSTLDSCHSIYHIPCRWNMTVYVYFSLSYLI